MNHTAFKSPSSDRPARRSPARDLAVGLLVLLAACGKTPAETDTDGTSSGTTTGVSTVPDPTTGATTTTGTTEQVTTGTPETTTELTSTSTSATTTTTGDSSSTGPDTTSEPLTGSTGTTMAETEGPACVPKLCSGKMWACGDCMDNDGDGKVDAEDVECVNPCDDDEGSFATGIPGDGMDACKQDCFFDGNSGAGDDGCAWNLKCDPENPGAPKCMYDPKFVCAPQDPMCLEVCDPPTGCDCFGCCSVYVDGELHDILLGDKDCSIEKFDQCSSCTKTEDCSPEECQPELCKPCINQPLPPDCEESMCEEGEASCKVNADCPGANEYCALGGCCKPTPQ